MTSDPSPTGSIEERLRALEDTEAVRQLMARYHDACDGWDEMGTHKDPAAIAALFTENGVWGVTAREPPPTGRAQVAALAEELQSVHRIVHFAVNPIVHVDGDTAVGEFKGVIRVQLKDSSPLVWSIGLYRIVARRTPSGWRFRSMLWEPTTDTRRYEPAD